MTAVILGDTGGLCGETSDAWRAAGRRVLTGRPGPGLVRRGDDWTLDLTDVEHVTAVLGAASPGPITLVYALSGPPPVETLPAVEAAVSDALAPLLHIAGRLAARWLTEGGDLHVLTSGGIDPGTAALVAAPVHALALTLRYEFPALRVYVSDLATPDGAGVTAALTRTDDLGLTSVRSGGLHHRVIESMSGGEPATDLSRPGGVQVITGGLGGVGRHLVAALRSVSQAPIALIQRRAPSAEDRAWTGAWSRLAPVRTFQADVSDRAQLATALDRIRADLGPIRTVIHAAGTLADGLARSKDLAALHRVLAPKVRGTWLLDELTADDPVTDFVLCSSTVSLYGARGQSDYAAANAFLDAFAALRAERRPGSSMAVNWSMWSATGMAADLGEQAQDDRPEVTPLRPAEAARILVELLGSAERQIVVEDRGSPAAPLSPLLTPVRRTGWPSPAAGPAGQRSGGAETDPAAEATVPARDTGAGDPVAQALRLVGEEIHQLTGSWSDAVDDDFFSLGLDSGALLRLAVALSERLSIELYPTLLFEFPTPRTLAEHLAADHAGRVRTTMREPSEPATPVPDVSAITRPAVHSVADDDDIAIVGYSYRLPGAEQPGQLWPALLAGATAFGPMADVLHRSAPAAASPDGGPPRYAALLSDEVTRFDPLFFKIAPKDAAALDPQHRLALTECWQALEHAGHAGDSARELRTGVFLGVMNAEYELEAVRAGIPQQAGTGSSRAVLANLVSYSLDLRGPSMPVETACSSSLVAIHLAAESLRCGEAGLALAGGVNVIVSRPLTDGYLDAGLLSPSGACRPFDQAADGYVRGEGVAVVVLRRLADAVADGDTVYGVIKGSAVGHGGHGNGLGAPQPERQAEVIRAAVAAAGLQPTELSYVEAHGTGTTLGDPVELRGLALALGTDGPPCYVSALKGNVGHLEPASGVAALIKVLYALRHGVIPPIAGLTHANPLLPLEGTRFRLVDRPVPWTGDRYAGISSFGFGGVNCHLVVAGPPVPEPTPDREPQLLLLSARTPAALNRLRSALAEQLDGRPAPRIADVARTLAAGRRHFRHRDALVVASTAELGPALRDADRPTAKGHPPASARRPTLRLGPLPAAPVKLPSWLADEADDLRWRPARDNCRTAGEQDLLGAVQQACSVARWLHRLGVPEWPIVARGTGVLAAAVLAGVVAPDAVPEAIRSGLAEDAVARTVPMAPAEARLHPTRPFDVWLRETSPVDVGRPDDQTEPVISWPAGAEPAGWEGLLRQLAEAYVGDAPLSWPDLTPGRRIAVPGHPLDAQRYWQFDDLAPPATPDGAAVDPPTAPRAASTGRAAPDDTAPSAGPGIVLSAPAWPVVDQPPAAPPRRDVWVLYTADAADAEPLRQHLAGSGQRSVVVTPGSYARPRPDHWSLPFTSVDDHARLLDEIDGTVRLCYLPSVSAGPGAGKPTTTGADLSAGLAAVAAAAKRTRPAEAADIIVAVAGALEVPGPIAPRPADAALAAFARVLGQEEPALAVRVLDVDRIPPAAEPVVAALGVAEGHTAWRAGSLLRFAARPLETGRTAWARPTAWWITGGLGGVGLAMAEHLTRDGVPIVLSSRRGLPDQEAWARIAADTADHRSLLLLRLLDVERRAGALLIRSLDVGDAAAVQRVAEEIRQRYGPGYGVVHAAGMPGAGRRAVRLTADHFDSCARAKVLGAQHLDEVTRPHQVRHFVAVSSLSAVTGGLGLGDYAAANGALDAVIRSRRAAGLPAVSISWTALDSVGMAARTTVPMPAAITIAQAMSALPMALSGTVAQVIGIAVDAPPPAGSLAAATQPTSTEAVDMVPDAGPRFWKMLRQSLGAEDADIPPEATLADLGLDSRDQIKLIGDLEAEFQLDLPLEVLTEGLRVVELLRLLDGRRAPGDIA